MTDLTIADDLTPAPRAQQESAGVSVMARERYEIEGAMIMARQFPRQEPLCRQMILAACERPIFADGALYEFPRGGQKIIGPSVKLAREMARIWGNVRCGHRVLATDPDRQEVHIQGFAFDVQTNAYQTEESKARTRIYRKKGGWIDLLSEDLGGDTERQLGELVGRTGAKLVRNCLLRLFPADLVDEAVEGCKVAQAVGVDPQKLKASIRYFAERGVSMARIEAVLGKPIREAKEEDIASLRRIAASVSAGETTIDDSFPPVSDDAGAVSDVADESQAGKLARAAAPKAATPAPPADVAAPQAEDLPTTRADLLQDVVDAARAAGVRDEVDLLQVASSKLGRAVLDLGNSADVSDEELAGLTAHFEGL